MPHKVLSKVRHIPTIRSFNGDSELNVLAESSFLAFILILLLSCQQLASRNEDNGPRVYFRAVSTYP